MIHARVHIIEELEIETDGGTVTVESEVGQVVRATTDTGGYTYTRLQYDDGRGTFKWSGDPADVWNGDDLQPGLLLDPENESRWVKE